MSTELAIVTPDVLTMIDLSPDLAESTKAKYSAAVTRYLDAGGNLLDAVTLATYAESVSNTDRAHLKAVVKLYTDRLGTVVKATVTPETVGAAQANLMRLNALQEAVKVRSAKGTKIHTWLSQAQVKALLDTCAADLVGQRDRLLLGILVGAGLRREELATLTFEAVKLQPIGERFRTVLDIQGKGSKARAVPIGDPLANALDEWSKRLGHQGNVARRLGRKREIGESMSPVAIFNLVRKRGALIGKPDLAPHDLRRTYAQLGLEAGIPITQISVLLGHASVATTQKYLNLELDLEVTVGDFIPF